MKRRGSAGKKKGPKAKQPRNDYDKPLGEPWLDERDMDKIFANFDANTFQETHRSSIRIDRLKASKSAAEQIRTVFKEKASELDICFV